MNPNLNNQTDTIMNLVRVRGLLDARSLLSRGLTADDRDILKVIVSLQDQLAEQERYCPQNIDTLIEEAIKELD